MAQRTTARTDFVPHLPDLLVTVGRCWRAIRDAQTEVDPFGSNFGALAEARVALEGLAHRLTGQRDFFALVDFGPPADVHAAEALAGDAEPF